MSRGLSKEPFLSDVERLRRLMKVEDELARLKSDYDRTREIVDLLVNKFEGHVHDTNGGTRYNDPLFSTGMTHTSAPLKQ